MIEFVTSSDIIIYVGIKFPSEADTAWAEACARAVNDGIMVRLNGAPLVDPLVVSELHLAAVMAGGEAYKRREAPFGQTGYQDVDGNAVRFARDYLDGVAPLIERYNSGPGMA